MKKFLLSAVVLIAVAAGLGAFAAPPADCFANCMFHSWNCGQSQCGGTAQDPSYCICGLGPYGQEWVGCTLDANYAAANCHACCGDMM